MQAGSYGDLPTYQGFINDSAQNFIYQFSNVDSDYVSDSFNSMSVSSATDAICIGVCPQGMNGMTWFKEAAENPMPIRY